MIYKRKRKALLPQICVPTSRNPAQHLLFKVGIIGFPHMRLVVEVFVLGVLQVVDIIVKLLWIHSINAFLQIKPRVLVQKLFSFRKESFIQPVVGEAVSGPNGGTKWVFLRVVKVEFSRVAHAVFEFFLEIAAKLPTPLGHLQTASKTEILLFATASIDCFLLFKVGKTDASPSSRQVVGSFCPVF